MSCRHEGFGKAAQRGTARRRVPFRKHHTPDTQAGLCTSRCMAWCVAMGGFQQATMGMRYTERAAAVKAAFHQ